MEYNKIISVTGLPGLFELVSSKNDGAIVRSLDEKTTKFVSSRIHNFSHLESIEVYTNGDNVNLAEVFGAMEKSAEKIPGEKDPSAIKKYFESVYPEIDFSRVYNNDMKKMIRWFTILKNSGVEIKVPESEPEEEASEETVMVETAAAPTESKAKSKKAATAEVKAEEKTPEVPEEAPKKAKTAAPAKKKKAE